MAIGQRIISGSQADDDGACARSWKVRRVWSNGWSSSVILP